MPLFDDCPHNQSPTSCPICAPAFLDRKLLDGQPDINRATIRGTVEDPPAFRRFDNGQGVVLMTVKTVHRWQTFDGERTADDFHRIAIFDAALHGPASNCSKGSRVELQGHIQTRKIPDNRRPGEKRTITEIVLNHGSSHFVRLADPSPKEEGNPDA